MQLFARVAMAALLVASCGGGAAPTTTAPSTAGSTAAGTTAPTSQSPSGGPQVTVKGFRFQPQTLEVGVGTSVTWKNEDGSQHTTTSGRPGAEDGKWAGELDASGGAFAFKFIAAGTFAYFCSIHGQAMTGTIVVK